MLSAERQQHNRSVRLAVWFLANIPRTVAEGIALAFGKKKIARNLSPAALLKIAPDYERAKRRRRT